MARLIIGRVAIFAGLLHLGAVAEGVPASDPPAVPLVEVQIRSADGGTPRAATGIVWPGGGVLVRLKGVEDAAGASIRAADGVEHQAQGVLTYQTEAGVALLAVDWGGEAPHVADIALEAPRPGDRLWLQFIEKGERAALRADVRAAEPLKLLVGMEEDPKAERIAGGPLVNEAGAIVGIPSGMQLEASIAPLPSTMSASPVNAYIAITAARCEALRAIKAGPPILWADWSATTVPNIREARKLVEDASELYRKGQATPDAMVQSLQRAVELDPQNATAWRSLTYFLYMSGQYEPAIEAAKRTIGLTVTDGSAFTTASLALFRLGRLDSAVSAVNQAIALGHELPQNYSNLGSYLWQLGRVGEAVEAFKKCLALDPKNEKVRKALAYSLRLLGRDEEARQYE